MEGKYKFIGKGLTSQQIVETTEDLDKRKKDKLPAERFEKERPC